MFNCQVATNAFEDDFLNEAQKISSNPVILVPVSKSGITCGANGACYWNSNLLAQTFGGKSILGFNIYQRKGFIELMGHSNWLTPEGELIDVTKSAETTAEGFHYFLPLSCNTQAVFSSKSEKTLANYIYVKKAWDFKQYLRHSDYVESSDQIFGFNRLVKLIPLKTLFSVNAVSTRALRVFLETLYSQYTTEGSLNIEQKRQVENLFLSSIKPASSNSIQMRDVIDSQRLSDLICKATETGKHLTDLHPDLALFSLDCFTMNNHRRKLAEYAFDDISQKCETSGKHIWEIPPCEEAVINACKEVNLSDASQKGQRFGMSAEEYTLWTSDFHVPHPYLTLKARKSTGKFCQPN